jgi:hypothetical protein
MLDILNKHLLNEDKGCAIKQWIDALPKEEQDAFALVKQNSENINVAALFTELIKESALPFKLTAFRSHLRGYCTCQN